MNDTLVVDQVAKTGSGFRVGQTWYNADKKAGISFASLKAGDVIRIDDGNGTWVKAFSIVSNGPATASAKPTTTARQENNDRDGMIARSTVVKAFSSAFANAVKDMGADEGYQFFKNHAPDLEFYIVHGQFPSENA